MKNFSRISIRDLNLEGRYLFLRVDFNVPLNSGRVVDDTRIQGVLPTIDLALQKKARIVLASHLGRPGGKFREEFSLRPVAHHLSSLMKQDVGIAEDCIGIQVEKKIQNLKPGKIILLENLRFHEGEISNDPNFSHQLGKWAQEYVNDAFGTAHRAHASTLGVPQLLGTGATGLLMERELDVLSKVMSDSEPPIVAILGGAKISEKIEVIDNFLGFADTILVGGGMAYTFLRALGKDVGKSIVERDKIGVARDLIESAKSRQVTLKFPIDHVIAEKCESGVNTQVSEDTIPANWMGLDIGPRTIQEFGGEIRQAKTVIWNGPLGVFEIEEFSLGTLGVARLIASSNVFSVVGGGDSVAAVRKANLHSQITHLCTGGGACLEFLAGKKLAGVEVLTRRGV